MSEAKPKASTPAPVVVDLEWEGGLRFHARAGEESVILENDSKNGLTPVQALALGLAGCMAMDVAHVLRKSRLEPSALRVHLEAERQAEHPRRLLRVDLHFKVAGEIPPDRVERAIALSRETYCSVWHSMRPDIELRTSFEVVERA